MSTDTDPLMALRSWFSTWDTYVRARDFVSARALFVSDVSGFGTHAAVVHGLPALEGDQWRQVWPTIADFRFDTDKLHGAVFDDHAWAAVPWTSTGFAADGTAFPRPGRATVVFKRVGDRWLGVHTHFSLAPGVPGKSFGHSCG
jgi:ketosteroid isomerase-like protein